MALGLLPIDATFARFDGWLTYDPDDRASCRVELHVQVASMVTDDPAMRDTIVGPDFMDAASFPDAHLCRDLRGEGARRHARDARGHPAVRAVADWNGDGVVAEGRLVRADWGMTAMSFLGGRTVRIRVTVPLMPDSHRMQDSDRRA